MSVLDSKLVLVHFQDTKFIEPFVLPLILKTYIEIHRGLHFVQTGTESTEIISVELNVSSAY